MRNLILALIVLVLATLAGSIYVIDESQVGIRFQLGRIVESDIKPGLHFKLPFLQTIRRFDQRILTLDAQPERYLTSEKKDVNIDYFAKWRIADVGRFYTSTAGSESNALARLTPIITSTLRNHVSRRTLKETVADARGSMTESIVRTASKGTAELGIEIVDIRVKRIDLPERVSKSVFDRMRAERARVANELRSEGREISETIQADADRQRAVLLAEAERDAARLRGQGDARSTQIYADAYQTQPEFYAFFRSLEAYRRAFADGRGTLILDPDSEFFRYLRESSGER